MDKEKVIPNPRHSVFRPARMTPQQLENGYHHAYQRFYQWRNIFSGAMTKDAVGALRHLAYAGGWKKFEWLWHALIRAKQVTRGLPLLERALDLGHRRQVTSRTGDPVLSEEGAGAPEAAADTMP